MQKHFIGKDPTIAEQVKKILGLIKKTSPGNAVELRIPYFGAIQCVAGIDHRRGTPPNQVEMMAEVLIKLAHNPSLWYKFVEKGEITASGHLSDLSQVFLDTFKQTNSE